MIFGVIKYFEDFQHPVASPKATIISILPVGIFKKVVRTILYLV